MVPRFDSVAAVPTVTLECYLKIRLFIFLKALSIVKLVFLSVYLNGSLLICKDTDTFAGSISQRTNALRGGDALSGYIQVLCTTATYQCTSSMGQNTGKYRSLGCLKEWTSTKWYGVCSSDLTYLKSNLLD